MRKLASIQKIEWLKPIEGKDRIELAGVLGYSVVVKKQEFKVGDLCVFCEIDSVLPEKPEFEFLRSKKFRIRTMKLGSVYSQGIVFELDILPPKKHNVGYELGEDVTKVLGITQYAPTMDKEPDALIQRQGEISKCHHFLARFKLFRGLTASKRESQKGFPSFIRKTDETRLQNMPHLLQNKQAYIQTEKIDGQSGSFLLIRHKRILPFLKDTFEYIVCSRNWRLRVKDNSSYWRVSERYHIENALRNMIGNRDWIAIQGECIAPNVQKNKYSVTEPDLYVFNVIFPKGRLGSMKAKSIVENHGLKFVPILNEHYVLPDTMEEALRDATGPSILKPDILREGIVCRTPDGQLSWKCVSPEYLVKNDE